MAEEQAINGQGAMTMEMIRGAMDPEEEGYDTPFATFTWRHWMEAQAKINQCFSRFIRAVEHERTDQALMIGLEVQEIATQMLLEAYAMCANLPLEDLPSLFQSRKRDGGKI